jgi:hypothetical protein
VYEQPSPVPRPLPGVNQVFRGTPEQADPQQTDPQQTDPQQTDPRAGIDEAVTGLGELDQLPLAEHVERFDAVHTELTVALSSIDKV